MTETAADYIAGKKQSELREKLDDMTLSEIQELVNNSDYSDEHKEYLTDLIIEHPEIYEDYYK